MPRASCELEYAGSAASRARRFVRETLRAWHLDDIGVEAELVATEVVTNAVLHGAPPIFVELTHADESLRIAVGDGSNTAPVAGIASADAMTGRGLQLVASLSTRWGATPREGNEGKVVWAEIGLTEGADDEPPAGAVLLAAIGELPDVEPRHFGLGGVEDEPRYEIVLGDVPTDLLVAAKAHVDNVVRELTLASGTDHQATQLVGQLGGKPAGRPAGQPAGRPAGQLGGQLGDLLRDVVIGFSEARQSIKRQAIEAANRGDARTRLTLVVGPSMADAGERYLAALDEIDEFARAARLLTVESPPQHRAFRHWYVQSLVDQVRARAGGERPSEPPTFERFLLDEVAASALARHASERAARLQRVTAALASAITPDDVANVAVAECVFSLGAAGGALLLCDHNGQLGVAGTLDFDGSGWTPGSSAPVEAAIDAVLASGTAMWIENLTVASEVASNVSADVGADGSGQIDGKVDGQGDGKVDGQGDGKVGGQGGGHVGAACVVPLAVAGDVIGVFVLSYGSPRLFDADERAFVEAVAAETAQTLTRTRLHEEQTLLAQRLTRLQAVAGELARQSHFASVCEAAVRHATAAVGAAIGAICLPTADGQRLRTVQALGGDGVEEQRWREVAIDGAYPVSVAYRRKRPIVVDESNWDLPEFAGYPAIQHPLVCLPLRADNDVIGVLALSFTVDREMGTGELRFLTAVADVCAQALARGQAFERATQVSDRFAFLAEASHQLAASLNYRQTLQRVAELAVSQLADWCGIDLLEGDEIRSVAVAHTDPDKVAAARQLRAAYPSRLGRDWGVSRVIATGEPLSLSTITREMLAARIPDPQQLELVLALGVAAVLVVPLHASGRVLGAMWLVRGDSGRPFTADDASLAEDLGGRTGTAVDNARLFSELQALLNSESGTSHAQLELALTTASIGSFDWDLTTNALTWDARMCAIYGIDFATFDRRAESVWGAIVDDDRPAVEAVIARAVERLGDYSAEYRIRRPDGELRWVDSRGRVLPGLDGKGARMVGVAFDSTQVRETRDLLARTLEHMGDGFCSLDSQWRVTYANRAAERILGVDRAVLVGNRLWDELSSGVSVPDERVYQRAFASGRPVVFEGVGAHVEIRVQSIPDGVGVYFTDISELRQFEQERAELEAESRQARSLAELARARLSFIAEASADITTTLDPAEVCRRLATHAVQSLADWVCIYVLEADRCHRIAAAHRDPHLAETVAALVGNFPVELSSSSMVARAVRGARPIVEQHMSERLIAETYPDPQGRLLVEGIGVASAAVIPMTVSGEVVGVMAFLRSNPGNEFEPDELQLAETLATRAALAVQNAQLYARQTTVAQVLQQAVLPEALPAIAGAELSARYEPALGGAGVGGDFYDVFRLPSGLIALAVGDAAGHGLPAGALMGQLRNALRAYAVEQRGPSATLRSLSELIAVLEPEAFATAFYAELDPRTGELSWASAGHPPPLLTFADAGPRFLDGVICPPLGIFTASDSGGGTFVLPPGAGIFLYTDGLVERRRADISDQLEKLRLLAAAHPTAASTVDDVVAAMREDTGFADDVCVLFAVRSLES